MSSTSRRVGFAAIAFLVAACSEQSPTRSLDPSGAFQAQGPGSGAALEAQINALVNALYSPTDQGSVLRDFARIKAEVASGRAADAEASIIAFVKARLIELENGDLLDPNGAEPPSTADAFRDLLNSVATFGGVPAPIPPLGNDGAVAVVGADGGTVVTSTGFGGVQFPPGALPQDVIVVVERLPNPTVPKAGPLPTTLDQYPLFYDFSTTPPVPQFAQPVIVAMCQLEIGVPFGPPSQAVVDRLQIAHPNPANPTTVELLDRVAAPFLDCGGVSLAHANQVVEPRSVLARAVTGVRGAVGRALGVFKATPAYAIHGGLGGKTTSFSPFGAVDPSPFTMVSAGDSFACGVTLNGAAYCWGGNTYGQLGDGTTTDRLRPVRVSTTESFKWIGAGSYHVCALTTSNQARCWGGNIGGQLGDGTTTDRSVPGPVSGGHTFANLSVGSYTVCGITTAGPTYCWGVGGRTQGTTVVDFGALGAPAPSICGSYYAGPDWPCSKTPIQVNTALTFTSISVASWFGCGITASGSAHCWGWGNFYNLGNGSFADAPTPTAVSGGLNFQTVETGAITSCGTVTSGAAYCWGGRFFNYGQLGGGTENPNPTPGLVQGGLTFRSVRPSKGNDIFAFTCGVTPTDQAWCWGSNTHGQLGTTAPTTMCAGGSTSCSTVPVPVTGGLSFQDVRAGAEYACGVTTSGNAYCWGRNATGELGDGTTTDSPVPKRVVR